MMFRGNNLFSDQLTEYKYPVSDSDEDKIKIIGSRIALDFDQAFRIEKFILAVKVDNIHFNANSVDGKIIKYSPMNVDASLDSTYVGPIEIKANVIRSNIHSTNVELIFSFDYNYGGLNKTLDKELTRSLYEKILTSSLSAVLPLPSASEFESFFKENINSFHNILKQDKYACLEGLTHDMDKLSRKYNRYMIYKIYINSGQSTNINTMISEYLVNRDKHHGIEEKISCIMKLLLNDESVDESNKNAIKDCIARIHYQVESLDVAEYKKKIRRTYCSISDNTLSDILNVFNYTNDLSIQCYQYLFLVTLDNFFSLLKKSHLLNDEIINVVSAYLYEAGDDKDNLLIRLKESIIHLLPQMQQSNLLNADIVAMMLSGKIVNHSCSARLKNGIGLEDVSEAWAQRRWGYYCESVIQHMTNMQEKQATLDALLSYAANVRGQIARIEGKADVSDFGQYRKNIAKDFYVDEGDSIIDPKIFPSIAQVLSTLPFSDQYRIQDVPHFLHSFAKPFFRRYNCYAYTWDNRFHDDIILPKEKLIIAVDANRKIRGVSTKFYFLSVGELKESINKIDALYFKPLMQKPLPGYIDLLTELGKFVFYSIKLYPFCRGTGAIVQWTVRSSLRFHYGAEQECSLGNLCLGPKNDIPYDVYAHLVKTPEEYAAAFKATMEQCMGLSDKPSLSICRN